MFLKNQELFLIPIHKKTRVLAYLNEHDLDDDTNFAKYLALNLARDPYFQVVISTGNNPQYAKQADVVISEYNPKSSAVFLKPSEILRQTSGDQTRIRAFVQTKLKPALEGRVAVA